MQRFSLTLKSSNAKTGPIPVSMTSNDSCPESCPLRGQGCYAENGPLSWAWRKMQGTDLAGFVKAIAGLPEGQLWRHNQAGDLPGQGDQISAGALAAIVRANKGRKGFTYTHKPPVGANAKAIARANTGGFTVNLSADNLSEADEFMALGIGPIVVTLPAGETPATRTPAGNRIVVCPAQTRDGVTCKTCGLCAKADRKVIVGFLAHGTRKALVGRNT